MRQGLNRLKSKCRLISLFFYTSDCGRPLWRRHGWLAGHKCILMRRSMLMCVALTLAKAEFTPESSLPSFCSIIGAEKKTKMVECWTPSTMDTNIAWRTPLTAHAVLKICRQFRKKISAIWCGFTCVSAADYPLWIFCPAFRDPKGVMAYR